MSRSFERNQEPGEACLPNSLTFVSIAAGIVDYLKQFPDVSGEVSTRSGLKL
jgi:hypothetical protein